MNVDALRSLNGGNAKRVARICEARRFTRNAGESPSINGWQRQSEYFKYIEAVIQKKLDTKAVCDALSDHISYILCNDRENIVVMATLQRAIARLRRAGPIPKDLTDQEYVLDDFTCVLRPYDTSLMLENCVVHSSWDIVKY